MVYREVLGLTYFGFPCVTNNIRLFGPQPAITRVNRQIREEAGSIYYAENHFSLDLWLERDYVRYNSQSSHVGYVEFCRDIGTFAYDQLRIPHIQEPLRHIRKFDAHIHVCRFPGFVLDLRFSKTEHLKFEQILFCIRRLGDDDTEWADMTSVAEGAKLWTEELFPHERPSRRTQGRLIHALWLLGTHLSSSSTTWVEEVSKF